VYLKTYTANQSLYNQDKSQYTLSVKNINYYAITQINDIDLKYNVKLKNIYC